MREYLFRGKTKQGEWVYGSLDISYQHSVYPMIRVHDKALSYNAKEVILESIGQYTEVTVKDDVRLFEGDIVNGAEFNGSYAHGKVVYYHGAFVVFPIGRFLEGLRELSYATKQLTVIGNVVDNPELIEGQTKE